MCIYFFSKRWIKKEKKNCFILYSISLMELSWSFVPLRPHRLPKDRRPIGIKNVKHCNLDCTLMMNRHISRWRCTRWFVEKKTNSHTNFESNVTNFRKKNSNFYFFFSLSLSVSIVFLQKFYCYAYAFRRSSGSVITIEINEKKNYLTVTIQEFSNSVHLNDTLDAENIYRFV